MPRAVLEIIKERIIHNCVKIHKFTGKNIIAVVKSNAYGIGLWEVVSVLNELDFIDYFAVASPEEGVVLRELGIGKKILVLGGILEDEVDILFKNKLIPVVSDERHYELIKDLDIPFHLKFDTGMGRLGFLEFFNIKNSKNLEGVMSHFSSPSDSIFSFEQIKRFRKIYSKYGKVDVIHMESSAGIIYNLDFTTHVRIGLAIYGEKPLRDYPIEVEPALRLKARVISVKELPGNYPISYGRTFVTRKKMKVGVVSFGYADGLIKSLSNRMDFLFKGKRLPALGNITMDMTIIDLKDEDVKVGDWVYIVNEYQTFTDLSRNAGTIPYELMCNIASRVSRQLI